MASLLDAFGVPLQRLDEALDLVNDRPPRIDGAASAGQSRGPAAPPAVPTLLTDGGELAPELEVGLFEISRGLGRVRR
jgi:hypothetical protein